MWCDLMWAIFQHIDVLRSFKTNDAQDINVGQACNSYQYNPLIYMAYLLFYRAL